jgi:hypothetical protein
MDLHGLVSGAIGSVNPFIPATLKVSTGYVTDDAGKRTETYSTYDGMSAQVQPLQWRDLAQIDGLNLNGTRRKIYLKGEAEAIVRVSRKGGDLIVISGGVDAGTYLVAQVAEQWPDWCSVYATMQDGS